MPNILDTIVQRKQEEVQTLPPLRNGVDDLRRSLETRNDQRHFLEALRNPRRGDVGLIAEVKKASPSAGIIRPDFDPVAIAQQYEQAGASCLSVLTDVDFFQGSLAFLKSIRQAVSLPLLRKDFIIDERQILEAIEWGADAILLIVAILTDDQLRRFHQLALEAGLTALVEVHDARELDRARAIKAPLIGVNNRDLKTFTVDLATTENLANSMRDDIVSGKVTLVGESGIHTRSDVERLKTCGASAILVGESLMRQKDINAKAQDLLGL